MKINEELAEGICIEENGVKKVIAVKKPDAETNFIKEIWVETTAKNIGKEVFVLT